MEILLMVLVVGIPVGIYLWRESQGKDPSVIWPGCAADLKLDYVEAPPRVGGEWKGRKVLATAIDGGALITAGLQCSSSIRVEIGLKAEIEREAGVVVPDRVSFGDNAFESRYMVRSTPPELGETAVDPAMRQKLLQMPNIRMLALRDRLELRTPPILDSAGFRSFLDIAISLAAAVDGS